MDDRLQIVISGQQVEGCFLHRSDSLIEVEIVAPFKGFRSSLHMASFPRARSPRGFRDAEGESSGTALLSLLYRLCSHMEKNRLKLREAYREYESLEREIATSPDADEFFVAIREEMSRALNAGEIDHDEYHTRISEARLGHSRYHERMFVLRQEFFRMNFPFRITPELQLQVLQYLRREILSSRDAGAGSGQTSSQ